MGPVRCLLDAYRLLLRLYPKAYREQYGEQMVQTLEDMLAAAPAVKQRSEVLFRTAVDLPVSIAQQQILYIGGVMAHEMPRYVKRNAVLAGLLLVPFAAALTANGMDKMFHNQTLYQSWLWHTPALALWVLWLPAAALLVALGSLMVYIFRRSRAMATKPDHRTADVMRTWPLVLMAVVSLGIIAIVFGHDSVHCLTGNPIHEVQHWGQTWHCVQDGQAQYPFHHPFAFVKRTFGLQ